MWVALAILAAAQWNGTNMSIDPRLIEFTKRAEGFRPTPYRCPAGRLTIGYGANLEALNITEPEAEFVLRWQLASAEQECRRLFPYPLWDSLAPERRMVLIDMCFNMGGGGLTQFREMRFHVERGNWGAAADAMTNSRWAGQVGDRASKLIRVMRSGDWAIEA